MRIAAGFSPFKPFCVHRFLISSPNLRIDARFSPFTRSCVHRFLISSPDLRIDAAENSFACYGRSSNEVPRPILIFVAARENSSACSGRGGNEVRVRFHSSLPRRRMVPPAERHYPTAAMIPDFRGQTWKSLQGMPGISPPACSDSGFQGVNLGIAARFSPETVLTLQ